MRVGIPFWVIQYNVTDTGAELVFPYEGKFYRLDTNKAPSEFWKYRKLLLWLTEGRTENEQITVDLSDKPNVWIELDDCEEIPESYPL